MIDFDFCFDCRLKETLILDSTPVMRSTFKLYRHVNGTNKRTFMENIWKDLNENAITTLCRSFKDYIYEKPVSFTGNFVLSYLAAKHYVLPWFEANQWIEANQKHLEDRAAEVLMGQSAFRFKSAREARFEKTDD